MKFFMRLRKYNMCLNPQKCAFRVTYGKLLGFMVSLRGIEVDPLKIKPYRRSRLLRWKRDEDF